MAQPLEPSATAAVPPTNDEVENYFLGLLSQPRLVARTNSIENPYTRPLYRVLYPITDRSLVRRWRDEVSLSSDRNLSGNHNLNHKIHIALTSHDVKWTVFVPLMVHGLPYKDIARDPVIYPGPNPPKAEHTLFLVVGVEAGACTWAQAYAAAKACRQILQQLFASHDIHVLVAELAAVSLSSPPSPSSPVSPELDSETVEPATTTALSTSHQQEHAIFREFDSTFDETLATYAGVYKYNLVPGMQVINPHITPLLPFPGQVIQPVLDGDGHDKDRPRGTLSVYLYLRAQEDGDDDDDDNDPSRDAGTLYALTSRHVAIGRNVHEDRAYHRPQSALPAFQAESKHNPTLIAHGQGGDNDEEEGGEDNLPLPTISIAWGSNSFISDQHTSLRRQQLTSNITWHLEKRMFQGQLDADGEQQLAVAKRCTNIYTPRMLELLQQQFEHVDDGGLGLGAGGRIFGEVEFSDRMDYMQDGHLRDWALVAIHNANISGRGGKDVDTNLSVPHPVPHPPFYSNHAFIGSMLTSQRNNASCMLDDAQENERRSAFIELLDSRDRASFVKLDAPATSDVDTETTLDPQYVFKNGGATASSMGVTSPIEAVLRTPFPGREFPGVLALPILTMPPVHLWVNGMDAVISPIVFSQGGDSGAAIFDKTGKVVAMLDGGIKADKPSSGAIDITYATPMAAVFADIQKVTKRRPVMI